MCHKNNLFKSQLFYDGVEVSLLILGRIGIIRGLVRSSPTKKIEGDYSTGEKMRNEPVIKMKIVWKAVHQNDGGLLARILANVNTVLISSYSMLQEVHFSYRKPYALMSENRLRYATEESSARKHRPNNIGGGWLTGRLKTQGMKPGQRASTIEDAPFAFAVALRILRPSTE